MPGQERHPPAAHPTDRDRAPGRAERGLDLDLLGGREQLVHARAADDGDAGRAGHPAHATFEPVPELPAFSAFFAGFDSPDPGLSDDDDPESAALPEEPSPEPFACLSLASGLSL